MFGFISFYFPGAPMKVRATFMPYHRIVGGLSFVGCSIQVIIGHTQLAAWDGGSCFYSLSCENGIEFVYIFLMISLVLYVIGVMCCIIPPKWRRQKTPDEEK
ncbi:hypothetical protein WR25_09892 isoform C [Diploscapter pachys]|uniref:Cytochrome b561 domain-containing protein n=1 Tax=Diploscapter pachys TaxID=2018661 RepID=A0A2A2JC07_9BILA|nr:hypothetical protein WR25_09892 isoform A [Diploscapter pachys]PAV59243.1 hypothetical protein WR25_09892 isoform B [Diploscapter pachys]PAV59244.1 hypothetical protein WR25_09892 isoform C [Diploscapter pachys]